MFCLELTHFLKNKQEIQVYESKLQQIDILQSCPSIEWEGPDKESRGIDSRSHTEFPLRVISLFTIPNLWKKKRKKAYWLEETSSSSHVAVLLYTCYLSLERRHSNQSGDRTAG